MTPFVIVARRTITEPGDRARRLQLAYGVLERRLIQPAGDVVQLQSGGISAEIPSAGADQRRSEPCGDDAPVQPELQLESER